MTQSQQNQPTPPKVPKLKYPKSKPRKNPQHKWPGLKVYNSLNERDFEPRYTGEDLQEIAEYLHAVIDNLILELSAKLDPDAEPVNYREAIRIAARQRQAKDGHEG